MKVGVIGSRSFDDYKRLETLLDGLLYSLKFTTIVSGGAPGADTLGERYADKRKLNKIIHKPDWNKHGMAAGFERNTLIVDDSDLIIACWDLESGGTKDSFDKAKAQNKEIIILYTK